MKFPRPSLQWLLVFVPVCLWVRYGMAAPSDTYIFVAACLAIIPLAGWLGRATEHLAHHSGEALGGFLNATFGNAAELIIAIAAMRAGLYDVVKASLTGSILGNMLLVMGAAFFFGGIKHRIQEFNMTGARMHSTMLLLSTIALVLPAGFHHISGAAAYENTFSLEIAITLLAVYGLSVLFTLRTHSFLFNAEVAEVEAEGAEKVWSVAHATCVLAGSTAMIAWISEILVGSVEVAAHSLGMSSIFVGVIVVAVVGNAAEHSSAILMAVKNRMDLAVGIAIGSSIQVAAFVAPLLVVLSFIIAPTPLNFVFSEVEVLAIFLSVLIAQQVTGDGKSNWFEGVQLLAVYILMGMMFYLLPQAH